MTVQRLVLVCLLYGFIRFGTARSRSQALFPSAHSRLKRNLASVDNLVFHHSSKDAHLLFEILMSGIHFKPNGDFSVEDGELASLRKTRKLEVICEDIVPRDFSEILRLVSHISHTEGHLHQDEFERTLLTLVYTTQRMANSTSTHQREAWAQSFVHLYKALKQDLMT
ncbi:protein FAM180A [Boleophthalmus pectinirostris]|uniref:protein FAM180A n=1 Tax=Boleophthalmus pectinirostris TaxID=150288 RepID=UPI000A1C64CF|nr:protein FAM180A [Boleophthalmus pectinirostris]